MRRWIAPLALALAFAAPAWAAKRPEPPILAAAATNTPAEAKRLLEGALPTLQGVEADAVHVALGELLRSEGAPDAARGHFDAVANRREDTPWREPAKLGLALLDAASGDERALSRLADASDKEGLPAQNVDKWLLLAVSRAGDPAAVGKAIDAARAAAKGDARLAARVEAAAANAGAPPPKGSPIERVDAAVAAGRAEEARRLCAEIVAANTTSDDAFACGYVDKRLAAAPVDPNKIGVLIPLSGKFETVGTQIKQALELGYGDAAARRKLVFVDSGETSATAIPALEKLVLEQGVIAVVGPLRTEMTADVGRVADALRVPLVGLSPSDDAVGRPWVRQAMITPREQVHGLVAFCAGKGMDAFATFAPDNAYGHTAAAAFKAELAERNLTLVAEVFYDAEATNLAPFAKQLARRNEEARAAELSKLRAEARAAGKDPTKVVLPPTIDYDAIFVPDSANRVPIATAGLGYEEFPIGGFQPKKGMATIPLLGLSGWNSDALASRAQPYIKGGLFTDIYARGSAPAFEDAFVAATQHAPTPLEAATWDIGKLLAVAARADAADRGAFLAALTDARATDTATGTDRFEADHTAAHHVRVLAVGTAGFSPADD